ncbi:DNA replication domain protein [Pectobacterium versatile]|uniref:DNA replication domain protein n=1 Tax=Pectobacterium versatile TaxID=2488639 RepID=UPI001E57FBB2|nr:DNA replication domain protein [Pectobacterium versatile]UEQ10478.1 DNA replication domain protein [Pectobacterium versatile]
MAGDWIKMRADLHTHPKVVRMASALKADRLRIVGGLHSAWCLFDVHSIDGFLDGYSAETLDDLIGFPGFSQAMIAIGWLEEEGESLVMPRFDAHNGQSAKRRAQDAERKRNVRKTSAPEADKMRTREEKRREDIKDKPPLTPPKQKKEFPYPDNLNVEAWGEWKQYRKDLKLKAYAPTSRSEGAAITNLINLSGGDRQRQEEIIKQSMANCWQGLFELKPSGGREQVSLDYAGTFMRLVLNGGRPANDAEAKALKLAQNAGLRRKSEIHAHAAWRGYLSQAYRETGEPVQNSNT